MQDDVKHPVVALNNPIKLTFKGELPVYISLSRIAQYMYGNPNFKFSFLKTNQIKFSAFQLD